ncbi:ATP-binding protein [Stagnimonas aquatica]|nr:ATP-binding protein [Stagnimonas aquatica]
MSTARPSNRSFSLLDSLGETASQQNAMLLIQLRWLAVFGQAATIVFSTLQFDLQLPLPPMFAVIGGLVLLNLFSMLRPRQAGEVRNGDLLLGLLLDISALTALLYFSGGATNPFVFLYLLQLTLAAILLEAWSTWLLVAYACLCFAVLTRHYLPLSLASSDPARLFQLHVYGMLVCFVLDVLLLVLFLGRINANLRRRDARLADLRQHAAEEDHIVRMGLLASGAAHELGTPLSTLAVILGDWRHLPEFRDQPERLQELEEMDAELRRCKSIVSGILLSAGEARGEAVSLTTVAGFLDELVTEWRRLHPQTELAYSIESPLDEAAFRRSPIVSDTALRQVLFNVLDNAQEASPAWVGLRVRCQDGRLGLRVEDHGPGFPAEMLARLGKPYQSSKGRPGSGLGLFLVVNVLRKLGGTVDAANAETGGAVVRLELPLAALSLGDAHEHGG